MRKKGEELKKKTAALGQKDSDVARLSKCTSLITVWKCSLHLHQHLPDPRPVSAHQLGVQLHFNSFTQFCPSAKELWGLREDLKNLQQQLNDLKSTSASQLTGIPAVSVLYFCKVQRLGRSTEQ